MRNLKIIIGVFCSICLLSACNLDNEKADFDIVTKQVDLAEIKNGKPLIMDLEKIQSFGTDKVDAFPEINDYEYELRGLDLSDIDLTDKIDELMLSTFDDLTTWPEKLPEGFDYKKIMEEGKNPGLNIRKLHEQGINGEGVSIAIIDQNLLEHKEYKDNLMLYEIYKGIYGQPQMHGPAVASIAVGKDVGVAPNANLYYISTWFRQKDESGEFVEDLSPMVDSIYRVIDINKNLPQDKKIRVLSISRGFTKMDKEYEDIYTAIEKAKEEGIFVITVSTDANYPFSINGLNRNPLAFADDINSYSPALFWEEYFYSKQYVPDENTLLIPMDARSCADFGIQDGYAYYRCGGLSWTCPWLAGFYALCVQVKNDITPDEFINLAKETGDVLEIEHNGEIFKLQKVINPEKIIEKLKGDAIVK